uniref:Diacylglycerol kinase n=1 Tax=Steinernema glaseri TaxID=37863 RepID=A0A1I7ZEV0_9BILA
MVNRIMFLCTHGVNDASYANRCSTTSSIMPAKFKACESARGNLEACTCGKQVLSKLQISDGASRKTKNSTKSIFRKASHATLEKECNFKCDMDRQVHSLSTSRKNSERFLPSVFKGTSQTVCRSVKKKALGPSLSWDPEHRSRSPSTSSRSRVHSADNDNEDGRAGGNDDPEEISERLDLERSCLHCSLSSAYKANRLKTEIESAVKRLARRLGTGSTSSWPRCHTDDSRSSSTRYLRGNLGTPDIIVSSISSDEDAEAHARQTSSEHGSSSVATSETSSQCSTASVSPNLPRNFNDIYYPGDPLMDASASENLIYKICRLNLEQSRNNDLPMDRLRLPGVSAHPGGSIPADSNSPPRSNSVDLSTLRRDIELFSVSSGDSDCGSDIDYEPSTPAESVRTVRSRSHEPSQDHLLRRPSRIEHLSEIFRKALAKSPVVKRAAALQEHEHKAINKHRTSRYWLDDQICDSEHIWLPSSGPGSAANSSADTECYIGDKDCEKVGEKRRCAACHIVAHTACFPLLSKMNLNCKATFRDSSVRKNPTKEMWNSLTRHHWVHRWKHEGRCQHCSKNFQQKMFRDKEVIAITCSWCKLSYHNKRSCFAMERLEEKCDRGSLRDLILPPSWLIRLPNSKKRGHKSVGRAQKKKKYRPFIVKPMDTVVTGPSQPLLVFVNPKSGGNKGSKALHTLCWLLNPRQVFDITAMKGPKYGLEMFRKVVTQLRILICGGDGTVGWVLSTLDQLNWATYPPMALLPLGTGNDLSRCMGWGGAFSDEPLSQLLHAILHETTVTYLDRWRIDVQPNVDPCALEGNDELNDAVQSSLPLTVMNNYFSIGADAHVALQFHHSRSANPQMLNSRFKNRIAYGGLGTIDLFKRSWKDLSEYITLECDGVDLTAKIKEFKFHCILFHNITYYAGGTVPWGSDSSDEFLRPSSCDGKIEVLGFTTATLAALQMGGKGERIAQCSRANIKTTKAIPMQVDGEPCLLAPSLVKLLFHSKVPMLHRDKKVTCTPGIIRKSSKQQKMLVESPIQNTSVIMQLPVIVVGRHDYDMYRDSFERLKDTAYEIGILSVESEVELESARMQIQKLLSDHPCLPYEPGKDWRFLDYVTNAEEGTFRVSRHQEHLHSISDICNLDECLMVLDEAFPSMTNRSTNIVSDVVFTPLNVDVKNHIEDDAATASMSSYTCSVSTDQTSAFGEQEA